MSTNLGGAPCCCFGLTQLQPAAVRLRLPPARATDTSASQSPARLKAVLEQVDQALSKGNDEAALSLVRSSQGGDGGLRAFGAARQVPQRLYTLDELKLNGIDSSVFLSPVDLTLGSIERNLQIAAVLGGLSVSAALELSQLQILFLILGLLSLWSVDFVYFGGGVRNLVLDTIGHYVSQKYHNRVIQVVLHSYCFVRIFGAWVLYRPGSCFDLINRTFKTLKLVTYRMKHEAGHFLIAYLLGVLPKGYTITSLDTLINQGSLNMQAGTAFVDYEFLGEINTGKLSATMVNKFSCIALAGVATEYLLYGLAEGGLADINKLDGLLKSLGFTQKKADSQVRWAVLNTVLILRRHEKARSQLAEAMSTGKSVGSCIQVIEECISTDDI